MIRFARCRSSSSSATRPASIVLPRPTSSASSRFTRGASIARATGSSWYSSTMTPERSGACSVFTSAEVTADQRTASRKAASRSGGSKPAGVTSGSEPAGRTRRPGSTSQMTGRLSPYRPSSTLCRVSSVLPSPPGAAVAHHPALPADLDQAPVLRNRFFRRLRCRCHPRSLGIGAQYRCARLGVIGLFIWARIDDQRQRSLVTGYPGPTARFRDHKTSEAVYVQHMSASCRRRPVGLCCRRARGTAARTAPYGSSAMDGRSTAKCDIDGDW